MKPLVSVIIPNYNHAPYLQKRINSVLDQTFTNFELLLLDDQSTDSSIDILINYKNHPKVSQFVINEVNSGTPFAQWRKGIELAQGTYIWIAESDDFAENTFLEHTVTEMEKTPSLSLTYCDSRIVNATGAEKGLWSTDKNAYFKTLRWNANYTNAGLDELLDYILYRTTINNASAVLFRKSDLKNKQYLTLISSFRNVGDLFTYLFVATQGDVRYLAAPLNNYRQHEANLTSKNRNAGLLHYERLICFSEILKLLKEKNLSENYVTRLRIACRFILKKNAFAVIETGHYESLKQFLKELETTKVFSKRELWKVKTLFKFYTSKNKFVVVLARKLLKKSTFLRPAVSYGKNSASKSI